MATRRYELIGNQKSYFARTMGDLLAVAGSNEVTNGVVIDGGSGTMDAAGMKAVLDSGGALAIRRPTDDLVKALLAVAGYAPSGKCYGILARRDGSGVRIRTISLIRGQVVACSPEGMGKPSDTTYNNPSANFLEALRADDVLPPPPQTSADTPAPTQPTMTPPAGTSSGMIQLNASTMAISLPWPAEGKQDEDPGYTDDPESNYLHQATTGVFNINVYVYWCNGKASPALPYFVVMVQFIGGPQQLVGSLVAQGALGPFSNGYIISQLEVTAGPLTYLGTGTAPTISAPTIFPGVLSPDGSALTVAPTTGIDVYVPNANGFGEATQDVGWSDTYGFTDWGSMSLPAANGNLDVLFYESSPLNYQSNPWQDFGTWYLNEYNGDPNDIEGTPIAHSTIATTAVPYQAVAVWIVTPPAGVCPAQGAPPASYPVNLPNRYLMEFQLYHAWGGCSGDYDGNRPHQWTCSPWIGGNLTIDLGQIVTAGQPIVTPPAATRS